MSIHVNDSGTWRSISQPYVYDNNIWRTVSRQYVNDSGVWKKVFPDTGQLYQGGGNVTYVNQAPIAKFEIEWSTAQNTVLQNYAMVYEEHPQLSYPGYYWKQISTPFDITLSRNTNAYGLGEDGLVYDLTTSLSDYNGTAYLETLYGVDGVEFDQIGQTQEYISLGLAGNIIGIRTDGVIAGSTPIPSVNSNWKYIATSEWSVAAVKTDGTLWLWGDNDYGGLGISAEGDSSYTYPFIGPGTIPTTLCIGGTNWDKVEFSKKSRFFHDNDYTYQRYIVNEDYRENYFVPRASKTNEKYNILASKTDGTLWSWGHGDSLGREFIISPTQTHNATSDWAQNTFGTNFKYRHSVSTNNGSLNISFYGVGYLAHELWVDSSAAIKTDGTLWTWGHNDYDLLGVTNYSGPITRPTPITTHIGGTDWDQVQLGNRYALAVKTDGSLWAWGNNQHGILGTGDQINRETPVPIDPGPWSEIAAGNCTSAGIKNNRLYVWGNSKRTYESGSNLTQSEANQVLHGLDRTSAWTPITTFVGGTDWKDDFDNDNPERYVSIGPHGMCAIKDNNKLWSWNRDYYNYALPIDNGYQSTPTTNFPNNSSWQTVHIGEDNGIGVKTDGTLWCWGYNRNRRFTWFYSQTTLFKTPTSIHTSGFTWKDAKSFTGVSYVLDTSNELYSIYSSGLSQGRPSNTNDYSDTDVKCFDATKTGAYSPNFSGHVLAYVKTNGTLRTAGPAHPARGINLNVGDTLVVGTTNTETSAGGNNWSRLSCGADHICAIKTDGSLWVWGNNWAGQLGINDTVARLTPVRLGTATNWKQVSCGAEYTAAVKTNGTLWVWGYAGPIRDSIEEQGYYTRPTERGHDRWFIGIGKFPQSYNKGSWLDNNDSTNSYQGCTGTGVSYQYYQYKILTPVQVAGNNWSVVTTSNANVYKESYYSQNEEGTRCALAATKTDGTLWVWGNRSLLGIGDSWRINEGTMKKVVFQPMEWYFDSNLENWCAMSSNYVLPTQWDFGATVKHVSLKKGSPNSTDTISVIKTDGTLWMWGNSGKFNLTSTASLNQSGVRLFAHDYDSQNYGRSTPITMYGGGTNWKKVSMSDVGVVATKTDGTLWVWDKSTETNSGNTQRPVKIGTSTNWDVAARHRRGWSALKTDGTLWVSTGAYPRNNIMTGNEDMNFVTQIPGGGTDWSLPSDGGNHTFIATRGSSSSNRRLYTWANQDPFGVEYDDGGTGPRHNRQPLPPSLGISDFSQFFGSLPIVSSGGNWSDFSVSLNHGGAIDYSGNLWMWGTNEDDELGLSSGPDDVKRVTPVSGPTGPWRKISCGRSMYITLSNTDYNLGNYTLAVKQDGTPWSWGLFTNRIGIVDYTRYEYTPDITYPKLVPLSNISHFSFQAQLGQTTSSYIRTTPIPATGGTDWKLNNTSSSENTMTAGGIVLGYYSGFSNLGPDDKYSADVIYRNHTYGHGPSAAIKTDGTLWTWGGMEVYYTWNSYRYNEFDTPPRRTPPTPTTQYSGGTNWKSLSGRGQVFAAIKTDGTLWCWGHNRNYQVGNNSGGTGLDVVSTPVTTTTGGTNWKQVSVGNAVTAAVKTDGTLWAWGNGHHVGKGVGVYPRTPSEISGGPSAWDSVSVGYYMSAGIGTNDVFYWWGKRGTSSSNHDSYDIKYTPVAVQYAGTGLSWSQLSVGHDHLSIIRSDGTLWMWGKIKKVGGETSYTVRSIATTEFTPGSDWKQVSCTADGNAAVKTDGTLWVWGVMNCGLSGNNTWPNAQNGSPPVTMQTSNSLEWTNSPQENYYISETPVPVAGNDWAQVSLVERSIMATKTDGTLWIWGGRTQYDYNMIESVTGPQRVELDITTSSVKDVESSGGTSFWLK
jgi:alpha-tubulin suppressor-like RCC1 family protein